MALIRVQMAREYFYDKTKVFGSNEAPASFDSLPETIVNIVCTLNKIQTLQSMSFLLLTCRLFL
jgi:hypothetical protein